MKPRHF